MIERTLTSVDLSSKDIGLVVAHGNGNGKSDDSEAQAIRTVLADVPVTAFKWSMGHTLCASGLLDAVLTSYALQTQCAPGIANLQKLASPCEGLTVSSSHQSIQNNPCALMINRGFSSMNACLVIKSCE